MTSERLLVFGASGHGKVVADAASAAGWEVLGFADDNPQRASDDLLGSPLVAVGPMETVDYCRQHGAAIVVAVGDNRVRLRLFEAFLGAGLTLATVIHPKAVVAPTAKVGRGSVVFGGAVINPASSVGDNVIVNTSASIDHDCVIGNHAHISPGAHLGGTVNVGTGTHVGLGVSVRNDIHIGSWSVIGVGAAVVKDIPEQVVAYGVPATARA